MTRPLTMTDVLDAAALAARAHEGQRRKDGRTPYVSHPFRVCLIVRSVFGLDDPRVLLAALLHDTIEDTTTDFDDLAERYSSEVAEWVALLTKDKRLPETAREKAYLRQLTSAPWQVQACKLADVYDNLADLATMAAERRRKSHERARQYLDALGASGHAELRRALESTEQLWNIQARVVPS